MKLRIGTRGSKLALWQANFVKNQLSKRFSNLDIDIVIIKTTGDTNLKENLSEIGGKGVFVKEIEESILNNNIDIAVHSLKDLPSILPTELKICSYLKRNNPYDAFISKDNTPIEKLKDGAVVATGSLRRKNQLIHKYPHINVVPIRGNIDTRLRKLENEDYDGLILAAAGLERLGLDDTITQLFDLDIMIPSPCQGIIAVESRSNNYQINELLSGINDEETKICACFERSFLKKFGGDCSLPIGCYSRIKNNEIHGISVFIDNDTNYIVRKSISGDVYKYLELGEMLADLILDKGEDF